MLGVKNRPQTALREHFVLCCAWTLFLLLLLLLPPPRLTPFTGVLRTAGRRVGRATHAATASRLRAGLHHKELVAHEAALDILCNLELVLQNLGHRQQAPPHALSHIRRR